jgi:hypothetical protein
MRFGLFKRHGDAFFVRCDAMGEKQRQLIRAVQQLC